MYVCIRRTSFASVSLRVTHSQSSAKSEFRWKSCAAEFTFANVLYCWIVSRLWHTIDLIFDWVFVCHLPRYQLIPLILMRANENREKHTNQKGKSRWHTQQVCCRCIHCPCHNLLFLHSTLKSALILSPSAISGADFAISSVCVFIFCLAFFVRHSPDFEPWFYLFSVRVCVCVVLCPKPI